MKINLIAEKEILDLENEIGYELVVTERPPHLNLERYYVSFEGCEVMKGRFLSSSSGNGNTIDEALQDYCKIISCKTVVFNPMTKNRKEFTLPKIIHTKLLKK